jgi:hypothetical protein
MGGLGVGIESDVRSMRTEEEELREAEEVTAAEEGAGGDPEDMEGEPVSTCGMAGLPGGDGPPGGGPLTTGEVLGGAAGPEDEVDCVPTRETAAVDAALEEGLW